MRINVPHALALPAGTILFREGEPGDEAFLIVSGEIEIFLVRDGAPLVLARLGPGDIVGEMAIVDQGPRTADARVVAECRLIAVSAGQLRTRLEETDPVLRMCLDVVLHRYRSMVRRMQGATMAEFAPEPSPVAGDILRSATETLTLEQAIRVGLDRDEFVLHYQPIVTLADGHVAGFEGLMRWDHPDEGLIAPGRFIPAAEASGVIVALTRFALARGLADLPSLAGCTQCPTGDLPFLSLNISGRDVAQADFPTMVQAMAHKAGIAPGMLKLEVTESMLMRDAKAGAEMLGALRVAGFGIALDDFGTGYSSLAYLSRLPVTTLKIDRAFVTAMASDSASHTIIRLIIGLGADLGIPVVAEGIETAQEASALAALGCTYGQGYHFGRPKPLGHILPSAPRVGGSLRAVSSSRHG